MFTDPDRHDKVIAEFRAHGGVVGGAFADKPLLLLHTVGSRSRCDRVSPLRYLPDGDAMVVVASNAGKDVNPAWYHNLVNAGGATVEVGDECVAVTAEVLTGSDRERWCSQLAEAIPQLAPWSNELVRSMPVIRLRPLRPRRYA